ncbi:MAG: peptidyl-prolyl cis-trans isomerase, partial [Deltaproteobacteria bacterium]|nr:peptidyl-prolyl cis-trans isomerase [Deltaproteobacteria bacterium]
TDFFSKDEPVPGLGGGARLKESLFALGKEETTDLIELNGKYYIFQVAERRSSYVPKLDEVRDKVKASFVSDRAAEAAKVAAEKFLKEVRSGKDWDALAKKNGLKTEHTDYFTRTGGVPKIGYAPELQEMAFSLSEKSPYPETVFQNGLGSFVIKWEGRQDIDPKQYEKEKEKYRTAILYGKQNRLFEQWLEALKAKAHIE